MAQRRQRNQGWSAFSHINRRQVEENTAMEQARQEREQNRCGNIYSVATKADYYSPCFLQRGHDGQHGNGWRRW